MPLQRSEKSKVTAALSDELAEGESAERLCAFVQQSLKGSAEYKALAWPSSTIVL